MRYLLDTNVLSEARRKRPSPAVMAWMTARLDEELCTSVICIGEIIIGIEALERRDPARSAELRLWLAKVEAIRTIIPVDRRVIGAWAVLRREHKRTVDFEDMLIAATAAAHNLTVATRNVVDFAPFGVPVIDPWQPRQ